MKYNPDLHHRRSIRLQGYDYARVGAYFVTICTYDRVCLFGDVINDDMCLNDLGDIVVDTWLATPSIRPNVTLDAFVVMPNHVHAIVIIAYQQPSRYNGLEQATGRGVLQYAPTEALIAPTEALITPTEALIAATHPNLKSPAQTLGAIVRGFKGATTKRINDLRTMPNVPIWQRGYYDHIIRNEAEMQRIRTYIDANPRRWAWDQERPS